MDDLESRTDRHREALGASAPQRPLRLVVTGDPDALCTPNGRFMLRTAVQLVYRTGRAYRDLNVVIPPGANEGNLPLGDVVIHDLAGIWSNDSFRVHTRVPPGDYDAVLSIGKVDLSAPVQVSVSSNGWCAYWTSDRTVLPPSDSTYNPIGAAFAAAGGVARLFQELEGISGDRTSVTYNTFTGTLVTSTSHVPNPPLIPIRFEQAFLVGAGALGHSFAWVLRELPDLEGLVWVIDPGKVKSSNLNRYLFAKWSDVSHPKARVLSNALRSHALTTQAFSGTLENFDLELGATVSYSYPLMVVGPDNASARRDAQRLHPHRLVNGGTSNYAFTISLHQADHILAGHGCLGCLYPQTLKERNVPCGESATEQSQDFDGSIAHISAACGAMMAAIFVKSLCFFEDAKPIENRINLYDLPQSSELFPRVLRRSQRCTCGCNQPQFQRHLRMKLGLPADPSSVRGVS